jgi:hypothetical protein
MLVRRGRPIAELDQAVLASLRLGTRRGNRGPPILGANDTQAQPFRNKQDRRVRPAFAELMAALTSESPKGTEGRLVATLK